MRLLFPSHCADKPYSMQIYHYLLCLAKFDREQVYQSFFHLRDGRPLFQRQRHTFFCHNKEVGIVVYKAVNAETFSVRYPVPPLHIIK